MLKWSIAAVMLAGALMLGGCKSKEATADKPAMAEKAVSAGSTTYLYIPGGNSGAGQVIAYSPTGRTCTQCDEDVRDYFLTGKPLDAVCKTCGATRTVQPIRRELLPGNVK